MQASIIQHFWAASIKNIYFKAMKFLYKHCRYHILFNKNFYKISVNRMQWNDYERMQIGLCISHSKYIQFCFTASIQKKGLKAEKNIAMYCTRYKLPYRKVFINFFL